MLTNNQVNYIDALLKEEGIRFQPVKEELLDHICCMVEEHISADCPFHIAVEKSFSEFQENELEQLQKQSIYLFTYKKRIMKIISFVALGLMLSVSTFWFLLNEPPSINPLTGNYEISSGFGKRLHPIMKKMKQHKGVDFKAPMGTPVVATSAGVIEKVVLKNVGYGNHIVIKHDDQYATLYAQLSRVNVEKGESVKKGQVIGAVGSSGTSTAPHLHYEVIKDGKHVDPKTYLIP